MKDIKNGVNTRMYVKKQGNSFYLAFDISFRNGAEEVVPEDVTLVTDGDRLYFANGKVLGEKSFKRTLKDECTNVTHIQGHYDNSMGIGKYFEADNLTLYYSPLLKAFYIQKQGE